MRFECLFTLRGREYVDSEEKIALCKNKIKSYFFPKHHILPEKIKVTLSTKPLKYGQTVYLHCPMWSSSCKYNFENGSKGVFDLHTSLELGKLLGFSLINKKYYVVVNDVKNSQK